MTERPRSIGVNVEQLPQVLRPHPQWVTWRWVWRDDDWAKVPHTPSTGRWAKSNDLTTCGTFEEAVGAYTSGGWDGVGFVLHPDNHIVGVDLDHCVAEDGTVSEAADQIRRYLDSYTEYSPSGTGLRILCGGTKEGRRCKHRWTECYNNVRFVTLTGHREKVWRGDIVHRHERVNKFCKAAFPDDKPSKAANKPVPAVMRPADFIPHADDEAVLTACTRLFPGFWPLMWGECVEDHSKADLSLCCMLATATRDEEQIDRVFRTSQLYREKWERDDYRERTIEKSLEMTEDEVRIADNLEEEPLCPAWGDVSGVYTAVVDEQEGDAPLDKKEDKARRWRWFHELKHLPEPEWLVGGHILRDSLAMLAGPPGSGKSFLALDAALSVNYGVPFLGEYPTTPGKVVYIAAEGVRGLWRRVEAWLGHRGIDDDPGIVAIDRAVDLAGIDAAVDIAECVQEAWHGETPSLLVVDTLARCSSAEENSATEVGQVIRTLDSLRHALAGCTILVVHHTGKDLSKGERGSSALRGAMDTLIKLDGDGTVTLDKQKDSEPLDAYQIERLSVGRSAVLTVSSERAKAREELFRAFGFDTFSLTDFKNAMKIAKSTAHDRLVRLETLGAITREGILYRVR